MKITNMFILPFTILVSVAIEADTKSNSTAGVYMHASNDLICSTMSDKDFDAAIQRLNSDPNVRSLTDAPTRLINSRVAAFVVLTTNITFSVHDSLGECANFAATFFRPAPVKKNALTATHDQAVLAAPTAIWQVILKRPGSDRPRTCEHFEGVNSFEQIIETAKQQYGPSNVRFIDENSAGGIAGDLFIWIRQGGSEIPYVFKTDESECRDSALALNQRDEGISIDQEKIVTWYSRSSSKKSCIKAGSPASRIRDLQIDGYTVQTHDTGPSDNPSKVEVSFEYEDVTTTYTYYSNLLLCENDLPKNQTIPSKYE